jgi:hypothetical protein
MFMTCSTYWGEGGAYRGLVGKLWRKRPLQIPRCRWEDNIKINPKEIQWNIINCISLDWSRYNLCFLLNMIVQLGVP